MDTKTTQIASNSKRSQLTKDTMHTEKTWIPCAPVCTSSASQTLRNILLRFTYLPQLTGKGHDCSHCWYFLSVSILDPLIMLWVPLIFIFLILFVTPFVPWQNQMDLLWPQVRKLELVPTQKKHQWCHFMSFLVWATNNYKQRLAIEHIASATSGKFTTYR